ncbi:2-succinyl-5-enolpyruvyl-6-hydroxy-3-cyclohexene-1-carboxylic-acid synthase [Marivirga salinae]|uniref:2-succinyl-5-enolpyruvyl-6-hydroxy-3-cyclohexene-1-carboxylate synthase n=1 Tax=Marivirga salinarum TaxID=3059078 RepID=A0AA49GBF6_9BACT|nr:2-succinyl-5-enolpyruvyl-6-hydroxy-3-cyclohexene-1-carboxylic-acid synthase [Marivirga sp. BDSF4-3]WKK74895.2 2-succinyl-5-enolpyruvyl-6-hydroxy-3-cyclohexene-1-carboxylic-acid synthase [Marivirga sp. BDSF4-3]
MEQQTINNIAEICHQQGIEKAIISPGSRNAPLTLAFARYPKIQCYSISDERSAAFISMGIAQADRKPVAIICTSGSAALNYAPAIAEAYFQEIPLVVITADRPPEWIDQWDGQTIRQENIYGKHVKKSFNIAVDLSHADAQWQTYRIINEAVLESKTGVKGPVHVNIPFREPFYPEKNENWQYDHDIKIIENIAGEKRLNENQINELQTALKEKEKIAFVLGQDNYSEEFLSTLDQTSQQLNIPIFADVISNGHSLKNAIHLPDSICMSMIKHSKAEEIPDLIISFGKSIISKNLKLFLRKNIKTQWHVRNHHAFISDPFQALSKQIEAEPISFLQHLNANFSAEFLKLWKDKNREAETKTNQFLSTQSFSEFSALNELLKKLPSNSHLHLANSLSVRYANFIGIKQDGVKIWANRGTSGIDGSTSTAVGHAVTEKNKNHFLITGDVAFFYDRNAFWHKYPYSNLKIILLNNQGGSIFRMIKGPNQQAELEEFFETEQRLDAKSLCSEFGIAHFSAHNSESFETIKEKFLKYPQSAVLEIKTDAKNNQQLFEDFKNKLIS